MSFASEIAALARVPVTYVALQLDQCALEFGVAPCTATGTECYKTFATCLDKANYDRGQTEWKFTSESVPGVFDDALPLVASVEYLPTEIKDNLTVRARVRVTMRELRESDIKTDPYWDTRSYAADPYAVSGTFWKRFWARNRNYKGRTVWIYEGFDSLAEGDFVKRFQGVIDNVSFSGDTCTIEVIDQLQELDKIMVPAASTGYLASDHSAIIQTLSVNDSTEYASSGYVRINDEIIYYASKAAGALNTCTRGALGTTAAAHSAEDKVQACRYYSADNPFDHLLAMLQTDGGIASGDIDTTAFSDMKDYPGDEPDIACVVTEPTKLSELYFELVDLLDAKSWVDENNKITITKNLPNIPGRTYSTVTDDENIIAKSTSVDLNEESRITRVNVYWNYDFINDADDPASFRNLDVTIDSDAEDIEYLDEIEKTFFTRWFSRYLVDEAVSKLYLKNFAGRYLASHRDAQSIVTCQVELKDSGIYTGDAVLLTSDEIQQPDGSDITSWPFLVVKRNRVDAGKYQLDLMKLPHRKYCFIADDSAADFSSATTAEKEYGYICNSNGDMGEYPAVNYVIW